MIFVGGKTLPTENLVDIGLFDQIAWSIRYTELNKICIYSRMPAKYQ